MKFILAFLAALALVSPALAQGNVQLLPSPRTVTNASSTVAVTNTFQSVMAANTSRAGCIVENTGTNVMYVFFGTVASATIATSIKLVAGQSVYCSYEGVVYQGVVAITGTATETFYASYQ